VVQQNVNTLRVSHQDRLQRRRRNGKEDERKEQVKGEWHEHVNNSERFHW